ncbi:MAG: hypothetical protein WCG63_10780 [Opitutaceae bacterium]
MSQRIRYQHRISLRNRLTTLSQKNQSLEISPLSVSNGNGGSLLMINGNTATICGVRKNKSVGKFNNYKQAAGAHLKVRKKITCK